MFTMFLVGVDQMTWILKVKVGRNWFKIDIDDYDDASLLDEHIAIYTDMDECTDILLYKLAKVVKS